MTALNLPKGELLYVHRIRSALAQLDSHLNDMLVITRQGGDLAPARAEPFRLDETLKALVGSYVGAAQDRGCLIRLEIGERCGYVEGDSLRFHQVVNNLLNNAVKYTQEGEINLKVTRLDEQRVSITIQDTGIGIEASKIDAIWEPHVRNAADPYVRLTEGSGLGLAVVRLLVGMMGGEVRMSSERGKGTTVSLVLPLPGLPDAV
jgi:signal transduction histidine kinase